MNSNDAKKALKKYWGYDDFRGLQSDIISSILSGKNTVGLLPTGGGKSICYQIPGILYPGLTIVISPLVALMEDQHNGLVKRGIKSYHFKGSYAPRKLDETFRNLRYGNYKFAFFAPERISNPLFLEYLSHADISLLAIDEAHCISQWGFDFRPSYLNVKLLRETLAEVPVIALTASATNRVKRDMLEQLLIADANVYEGSIRRSNLQLQVKFTPNKERQLLRLMPKLDGTGIIYAKTRRTCEQLASLLSDEGFASSYYHAGLEDEQKSDHSRQWLNNEVKAMVATTAFGMGIDKGDVKWVVHWDAPDTLEGYYQEVGRAGRDGSVSTTYLLYHQYDVARLRKSIDELPDISAVERFYNSFCSKQQIAYGSGEGLKVNFSVLELAKKHQLPVAQLLTYIRLIQQRGLWQFIESERSVPKFHLTSQSHVWERLPQQDYELLIALFRLYPHASDGPVRIDLARFAGMMQQSKEAFMDRLKVLHDKGILEFQPEEGSSALFLTQPRPQPKALKFSTRFVDAWVKSKEERALGMLEFLQTESCLFQQIEVYFGQEKNKACGTCSNCTKNHYPDQSQIEALRKSGATLDDIWFDLNCSSDELRS